MSDIRRTVLLTALIAAAGAFGVEDARAQETLPGTVTEFALPVNPTSGSIPCSANIAGIVVGPDGNIWFTEPATRKIGKMTPEGVITEYATPSTNTCPLDIIVGSDGNLWYAAGRLSTTDGTVPGIIGRVTTQGVITEYSMGTHPIGSTSFGGVNYNGGRRALALGSDGNIWFPAMASTTSAAWRAGRITPNGTISYFSTTTQPQGFAAGPDGNLWYVASTTRIGKLTTTGVNSEYTVTCCTGTEIFTGPDGNLWSPSGGSIVRISTAGTVLSSYSAPSNNSSGALAADGTVWLNGIASGKLGNIDSQGQVKTLLLQTSSAFGYRMTVMSSGTVWLALDGSPGKIVRVVPGAGPATLQLAAIFSSAQKGSQSFLRFFNTSTSPGVATVVVRNSDDGQIRGTWTSPEIPAGAESQYSIATIEQGMVRPTESSRPAAVQEFYSIDVRAPFAGYFQHVLWRAGDGTLTNLSTCASNLRADATKLAAVHSSQLNKLYPSTVVVKNTGASAFVATLGIYDARTGAKLGNYTTGSIPAYGQLQLSVSEIEIGSGIGSPDPSTFHYVIKAEGTFPGFLQHLVSNNNVGVITDMSFACLLSP